MKDIELKPCPFCGGKGQLKRHTECGGYGFFYELVYVSCENCGARGGKTDSYFHKENELEILAIANWERRADNEQRAD